MARAQVVKHGEWSILLIPTASELEWGEILLEGAIFLLVTSLYHQLPKKDLQ